MADVTRQLNEYLEQITLSSDQENSLRRSREALAEKIKDSFHEHGRPNLRFVQQGSFDMRTIIVPIDDDGEYDLDYGVYLQGYDDLEEKWPSPFTVHRWIIDAVKDHTQTEPENKNTCVRVIFKKQYHIDLPSYIETDYKCKLSHLRKGWIQSQPKDITNWFQAQIKEKGEDLRNVVKILKGWADFQEQRRGKMPSGLVLTILAANNYVQCDRLDECVFRTVLKIMESVRLCVQVANPTDPRELVSDRLSDAVKSRFQEAIQDFYENLKKAYLESSLSNSCDLWRAEVGSRFPTYSAPDEQQQKDIKQMSQSFIARKTIKPWGY